MPTLRLTWTREDVNNPWPAAEGASINVVAASNANAIAQQAITEFQINHTVTESADGLTKVVEYTGTTADLQDYVSVVEPHLNSNFDNTASQFGIQLSIDVIPD